MGKAALSARCARIGGTSDRRAYWVAIGAITLVALALRIAAARGALWLDEAWSATFAQQAVTPIGVIWRVNHDNNHILNTLWLQLVGPDAPPMLGRALSIACGTATIPLAALFAKRRSMAAGIIAAFAFAMSPIMLTYGAEARGYAPMLAAAMAMLVPLDRWLDGGRAPAIIGLAVAALLGTLAQPIMLAVLLAVTFWVAATLLRRGGARRMAIDMARVMGPAWLAAAAVIVVMVLAARASPHGFTIGSYVPFNVHDWINGLGIALGWTLGFSPAISPVVPGAALIVAALIVTALLWSRRSDGRTPFYAVAILAYPLALALCHIGNVGIARYYLLAALALLLLLAEYIGDALMRGGWRRWLAVVALALFTLGGARMDAAIITELRGDPGQAITAMRNIAPAGTILMLPDTRMRPVLRWAAHDVGYPLTIAAGSCRPAPFLLIDSNRPADYPAMPHLCCGTYRLIDSRSAHGLSGASWWLFQRIP